MITRSRSLLTDALDQERIRKDVDWFPQSSSSEPLAQFLSEDEMDEILNQQLAWHNVKRPEHNEE